jgi:hypothetical protein
MLLIRNNKGLSIYINKGNKKLFKDIYISTINIIKT